MDVLVRRMEIYKIMADVFFNKLDNEDRMEAMTEAANRIRAEVLDEQDPNS